MDPCDIGKQTEEAWLQLAIDRQVAERKPAMQAVGFCHYCSSPVGKGELFCQPMPDIDGSCAEDYQRGRDALKRDYGIR